MLASVSPEKHPVLQDRAEFPRVYKELEYNRRILYLVTLSFKYLSEQSKQKKKKARTQDFPDSPGLLSATTKQQKQQQQQKKKPTNQDLITEEPSKLRR